MAGPSPPPPEDDKPPTLWQTIASVNAAFFGVQSSKNRKRDFTRGKPLHFVLIALVMTGVFAGVVWLAVRLILRSAGM
jgi:hypothetical protein